MSELLNIALTDSNPMDRLILAKILSDHFTFPLMIESVAVDQLITKLETEGHNTDTVALRIFLKYRAVIAEDFKRLGVPVPD